MRTPSDQVQEFEGIITELARRRSRMIGVEFDDLAQEGRLEVFTRLLVGEVPTERDITNSMRRYIRAVKQNRSVVYEPSVSDLQSVRS